MRHARGRTKAMRGNKGVAVKLCEYKWESIPSRDHSSANFLQSGRLIMLEFVLYDSSRKGVDTETKRFSANEDRVLSRS